MPFLTVYVNPLDAQLARIQAARAFLRASTYECVRVVMNDATDALRETWSGVKRSDSAGEGQPPAGDLAGPLDNSWVATTQWTGTGALGIVVTTQPTKLSYIRYGTGIYGPTGKPITPRTKRALYWEGAAHPVRSVRGSPPNDFIPQARALMRSLAAMRVGELITQLQAVLHA